MPIKQVYNKEIAKNFSDMSFDEQAKLYRSFKKQFDKLSDYNLDKANEYFKEYLEETVIIACNGDVIAQDFLTYIYKKGRTGLFDANLLTAYKWGIIASSNGSKLSMDRLRFFYQPAFSIIADHPKLDDLIEKYKLTSDNIEYFFAMNLAEMITSASDVNIKSMSKLPVIPESFNDENLRELERIRDRVIGNMMELL